MNQLLRKFMSLLKIEARLIDIGSSCRLQFVDRKHSSYIDAQGRRLLLKKFGRGGRCDFTFYLCGELSWDTGENVTFAEKEYVGRVLVDYFVMNQLSIELVFDEARNMCYYPACKENSNHGRPTV